MRATRRRWVTGRAGRRRVALAAGECGVKDQVSRTQPADPSVRLRCLSRDR